MGRPLGARDLRKRHLNRISLNNLRPHPHPPFQPGENHNPEGHNQFSARRACMAATSYDECQEIFKGLIAKAKTQDVSAVNSYLRVLGLDSPNAKGGLVQPGGDWNTNNVAEHLEALSKIAELEREIARLKGEPAADEESEVIEVEPGDEQEN